MVKVLDEYKGVILLFLVLVLFGYLLNNSYKHLDDNNTKQVTYYEK